MSDVGLHAVFESLAWSASVSLRNAEFAIHELLGQPVVTHQDHVTNPTELGFQDHGLDVELLQVSFVHGPFFCTVDPNAMRNNNNNNTLFLLKV